MFVLRPEEFEKKSELSKKFFFYSKCSFGHVECSFKKQVEIFPPRFKKSFSSSYVTSNTNISENSYRQVEYNFDKPGKNSVATNPKISCSKSETNENLQNFQKIIFILKLILWRHRVQFSFLIPLPKTFSPSTVNVRSNFWRFWKKRDFSKVWFFVWSYETKTAIFNFDIPAEKFFARHGKCSF